MTNYQPKDHYYHKAKQQGLPSRASFKIEELLKKYPLVKSGNVVVDLGAAPGGWTVLLSRAVGNSGKVLAIDLQALPKVSGENIRFLQADLFGPETLAWLQKELPTRGAHAFFSDLSPKLTGIAFKDAYLSFELCQKAWDLAQGLLRPGGHFVTKIFPGAEFQDFLKSLRPHFQIVKTLEPKATRKTSREVYVIALNKK